MLKIRPLNHLTIYLQRLVEGRLWLKVIIGIGRVLGMFRTAVNVTGDLTAAVVYNKWFSRGDAELDQEAFESRNTEADSLKTL